MGELPGSEVLWFQFVRNYFSFVLLCNPGGSYYYYIHSLLWEYSESIYYLLIEWEVHDL